MCGVRHCGTIVRGATTSSEFGDQFLSLRKYYPSTEKIRQVYPVWCSRSHNHTLFIKKLRKKLGVRPHFGGTDLPRPLPPKVATMAIVNNYFNTSKGNERGK